MYLQTVTIDVDRVSELLANVNETLELVARGEEPRDGRDRMIFLEKLGAQVKELDYVQRDLRSAQILAAA